MAEVSQDIPSQLRELAEKNVAQAREAFLSFIGAAQSAAGAAGTMPPGTKEAMTKAIGFAEENVKTAFDHAQKLIRAKDVQEVLTLQTGYATQQMLAMQKLAVELGALVQGALTSGAKK